MLCRVVVNPTRSNVDYYFFFFIEHSNKSAQQKYLKIVNKVQDLF